MKWIHKGHEFDELGEKLINLKSIYLFGAGVHGQTAYRKYHKKIQIKGFVDNDRSKQGSGFCGLPTLIPQQLKLLSGEAVVITAQPAYVSSITKQLSAVGILDVFPMSVFFPVLDACKHNEICIPSLSFLPTTVCNLKCKCCLNFSPFVKEHQVRPLEQLTRDLDLLFSKIDTLLLLHISGGEPLLYPHLPELVDHIAANYKDKLGRLEMTTNGTMLPSERLLNSMRNARLNLIVDDYRESLPLHFDKQREILSRLDNYGITYRIQKVDSWIDLAPFDHQRDDLNEEQLRAHFDACAVPWQEYRDGKLWLCNYAAYAEIAEIQPTGDGESFDLASLTSDNIRELVEFRLGYSEKGYTDFCKRCLGYNNNPKAVPVAEQLQSQGGFAL